ncbi:MAG: hypothetical protein GY856_36860 [bacterium]|nr:hypothetical protein [bacterium]
MSTEINADELRNLIAEYCADRNVEDVADGLSPAPETCTVAEGTLGGLVTTREEYEIACAYLEELVAEARNPGDLDTLCEWMREGDARCCDAHGDWDTSLPTFGGEEPADTAEIWSWDETRLIVGTCADDLEIVDR